MFGHIEKCRTFVALISQEIKKQASRAFLGISPVFYLIAVMQYGKGKEYCENVNQGFTLKLKIIKNY